jgi:hypothetical protein
MAGAARRRGAPCCCFHKCHSNGRSLAAAGPAQRIRGQSAHESARWPGTPPPRRLRFLLPPTPAPLLVLLPPLLLLALALALALALGLATATPQWRPRRPRLCPRPPAPRALPPAALTPSAPVVPAALVLIFVLTNPNLGLR